jgi:hypothetical protein
MNWKECVSRPSWHNLWYYPDICLEGLRNQNSHEKYSGQFVPWPGFNLSTWIQVRSISGWANFPVHTEYAKQFMVSFLHITTLIHCSCIWTVWHINRLQWNLDFLFPKSVFPTFYACFYQSHQNFHMLYCLGIYICALYLIPYLYIYLKRKLPCCCCFTYFQLEII